MIDFYNEKYILRVYDDNNSMVIDEAISNLDKVKLIRNIVCKITDKESFDNYLFDMIEDALIHEGDLRIDNYTISIEKCGNLA